MKNLDMTDMSKSRVFRKPDTEDPMNFHLLHRIPELF